MGRCGVELDVVGLAFLVLTSRCALGDEQGMSAGQNPWDETKQLFQRLCVVVYYCSSLFHGTGKPVWKMEHGSTSMVRGTETDF